MSDEDRVDVGVILTARVHAVEGSGGYDLTAENGTVTIKKFGAQNTTPKVAVADLAKALGAIKDPPS